MALVTITNPSISNSDTSDVTKLTSNDNDLVNGITDGSKDIYVRAAGFGVTPTYRVDISGALSGRSVNITSSDTTSSSYLIYGTKTGAATNNYGIYLDVSGATNNYAIAINAGRVIFGSSTGQTIGGTAGHQILGTTAATTVLALGRWDASATGPAIHFVKSRNATIGSNTIVQNNDQLGAVRFYADDGTDFATEGARIEAAVDGTPGTDDLPTRIVFATTADGASTTSDRVVINSSGIVGIGTTSPNASSILDLTSTIGALLVPRMTTAQRDALTAANGMIIYNTTTATMQGYINGAWANM